MRGFAATSAGIAAIVAALVCHPLYASAKDPGKAADETILMQGSPEVTTPEATTPEQRLPGLTTQKPEGGVVVAPRTHCNGTCMCSGSDCTREWLDANCSGKADCSGGIDGDTGKTHEKTICTCIKKATKN